MVILRVIQRPERRLWRMLLLILGLVQICGSWSRAFTFEPVLGRPVLMDEAREIAENTLAWLEWIAEEENPR